MQLPKRLKASGQPILRLPRLARRHSTRRGRRATVWHWGFAGHRCTISWRQFRTTKTRRTKKLRQVVIPFRLRPYREIALTFKRYKHAQRAKNRAFYALPQRVFQSRWANLVLAGFSLAGVLYCTQHLTFHPKIVLAQPLHQTISAPKQTPPAEKPPPSLPRSAPTRLRIPKIAVDTTLVPVGLQEDGTIHVPDSPWEAGWYQDSPTPGEIGPAIIVGHVDSPHNIAIFWRLRELQPDDAIAIERTDGSTATFKVERLADYPQSDIPKDEVYGNINYAGLRLITCSGTFNEQTQQYSNNIVVYAKLAQES